MYPSFLERDKAPRPRRRDHVAECRGFGRLRGATTRIDDHRLLIFGTDHLGGWHESLSETAIILLVAVPVIVLTRRLVTRLHYLEEFLKLCAWCRKLHLDNAWVPVEEFLQRKFDTRTSHGICPACKAEQRKASVTRRAS